VIVAILWDDL